MLLAMDHDTYLFLIDIREECWDLLGIFARGMRAINHSGPTTVGGRIRWVVVEVPGVQIGWSHCV